LLGICQCQVKGGFEFCWDNKKIERLAPFRDVNQDGADTVLVST